MRATPKAKNGTGRKRRAKKAAAEIVIPRKELERIERKDRAERELVLWWASMSGTLSRLQEVVGRVCEESRRPGRVAKLFEGADLDNLEQELSDFIGTFLSCNPQLPVSEPDPLAGLVLAGLVGDHS